MGFHCQQFSSCFVDKYGTLISSLLIMGKEKKIMKNKVREILTLIRPSWYMLFICIVFTFQLYLESLANNHYHETMDGMPLFVIREIFCIAWAVIVRIFIAFRRENEYRGKVSIEISAVVSTVILIVTCIIDSRFMAGTMIYTHAFLFLLCLSCLCCVRRKK